MGRAAAVAQRVGQGGAGLADLAALVAIPTVSSDPARAADVRRGARWVAARARRAGFEDVRLLPGARHPTVLARRHRFRGAPTLLLYAHYDVQPAGDPRTWRTPPFRATPVGEHVHGRGASDAKGQLMCLLLGAERAIARGIRLNLTLLSEGEEEIGSPGMARLLDTRRSMVRADAALIADTRMAGPGRPALTVGLRGNLAVELRLAGPPRDLHSGQFGGAVHNPAQALAEIIAALHDERGRIAVEGLYDAVRPTARTGPPPVAPEAILREAGVARGWGEAGRSAYARVAERPSLSVNGLTAGHQGPGAKSIIPAAATAKLSLRLVPDQEPRAVLALLRRRIAALVPPTMHATLAVHGASRPVLLDEGDAGHRAARVACRRVWGRDPVSLRSGGSIGLVAQLARRGIPPVLLGFALPGDRQHGPNERFRVAHLQLGARTIEELAVSLAGDGYLGRSW